MSYYCAGPYSAGSCQPISAAQQCSSDSDCGSDSMCLAKVPVYATATQCQLGSDPNFDCGYKAQANVQSYPPTSHIKVCVKK